MEHKKLPVKGFFNKVFDIQKALFDLVTANETNMVALEVKKEHHAATCLEAFVTGLRGSLGTFVRGMEPETLQKAFVYATKERDIHTDRGI